MKENENVPGQVPPALLLNGALNSLHDEPYGDAEKWSQYFLINYDYYGNNRYDFGAGDNYYTTLKNITKMEDEAVELGLAKGNAYEAVGKFLKAYFFTKMSLEMGDIPMKEALKGASNLTPKYDTQKEVFIQAFSLLDSSNMQLQALEGTSDASSMQGDFYYGNDLSKWRKLVNTYRLRLCIELSKKEDDSDLHIKQQVASLLGDPDTYPMMESSEDNLQYIFLYPTNLYPNNPGNFGFDALRYNCSDTYVSLLTRFQDPRVYVTSEPAMALADSIGDPTDFGAFRGANPGQDLGAMYILANAGRYSLLNRYRYYRTYTGEPAIEVGYPEMCFNIAEAINRGWVTSGPLGTAEDYYVEGIKASMASYDIPESGDFKVYFFKQGAGISDANPYNEYTVQVDFDSYYAQPLVKYDGNTETGLTQILQQRYLALYRHSGLESYFCYRRTGVPEFGTGPGNGNGERIAMRFQYMSNEKTTNVDNFNAALDAQGFDGNDDINALIWLLK
jgi:hypothetical protein